MRTVYKSSELKHALFRPHYPLLSMQGSVINGIGVCKGLSINKCVGSPVQKPGDIVNMYTKESFESNNASVLHTMEVNNGVQLLWWCMHGGFSAIEASYVVEV